MDLYKYVVPDRIDVLTAGRIRFSQAIALNDPFELRPFFETLVPERQVLEGLSGHFDLEPHLANAYAIAPREARARISYDDFRQLAYASLLTPDGQEAFVQTIAATLAVFRDVAPNLRDKMYETLSTRVGILSLSKVPDHPLMWAHYAAEHRGMVFVFDSDHPWLDRRRGAFLERRPDESLGGDTWRATACDQSSHMLLDSA